MAERSTEMSETGAEAAVAVAEIGLASRRAAKQAWLEAFAALRAPDSDAARNSWADAASGG
jgi:hypothetical protein